MARKYVGNKAVNHGLITNDRDYQNMVMLYNVLANKVNSDPRSLLKNRREAISRANNLVNAETTSLFTPNLQKVEQLYKDSPTLEGVSYDQAKSLVLSPRNKSDGEMKLIRGWHKGEVHHNVPVGAVSAITSNQPYEDWGDTLYNAGREMPITSGAYNGLVTLSAPGHNVAHFDPIRGQFFKGEGAQGANIILPGTSKDDAIYSLVDQLTPHLNMSKFAKEVDEPFMNELVELINNEHSLNITAKDLTSSMYTPTGENATVAQHLYKKTSPSMLNAATNKAYGTTNAVEAATKIVGADQIRTEREAKDARNEARRKARAYGESKSNPLPPVIVRPGTSERLQAVGLNPEAIARTRFI